MNTMGRSNAHGTAGFLGTLLFLLGGAPSLLLVLGATRLLERPWLAPVFLLLWTTVSVLLSAVLFKGAAVLFERRRESLGMLG